ncbi:hypothetical protein Mucpa_5670 [Mucilaginibacter paludis DSM 18603]|uniref:Uncharacterized protein n=1 Tax=Mucilaginibacter paludis DSM 18603 TaxID=714943 RepID=H1Y3H1_9SPHI|nr:hypothetical protein Mucpa_5670 [Mucilaginibacter paludis DSM 18603]
MTVPERYDQAPVQKQAMPARLPLAYTCFPMLYQNLVVLSAGNGILNILTGLAAGTFYFQKSAFPLPERRH